jgi:hypothetical protein
MAERRPALGGVTTPTHYGINGLGQCIVKYGSGVSNGGVNEYVYDLAGHLIVEYDSSGNILVLTGGFHSPACAGCTLPFRLVICLVVDWSPPAP